MQKEGKLSRDKKISNGQVVIKIQNKSSNTHNKENDTHFVETKNGIQDDISRIRQDQSKSHIDTTYLNNFPITKLIEDDHF